MKVIVRGVKKDSGVVIVEIGGIKMVVRQRLINLWEIPRNPTEMVRKLKETHESSSQ